MLQEGTAWKALFTKAYTRGTELHSEITSEAGKFQEPWSQGLGPTQWACDQEKSWAKLGYCSCYFSDLPLRWAAFLILGYQSHAWLLASRWSTPQQLCQCTSCLSLPRRSRWQASETFHVLPVWGIPVYPHHHCLLLLLRKSRTPLWRGPCPNCFESPAIK